MVPEITFCESTLESREHTLQKVVNRTGATIIHPYNDARIVAGQGTAALELLETNPDLDIILTPVGGGGLLSGSALSTKYINPKIKVIGTEPEQANDAFKSFKAGKLIPAYNTNTIAVREGFITSISIYFVNSNSIICRSFELVPTINVNIPGSALNFRSGP